MKPCVIYSFQQDDGSERLVSAEDGRVELLSVVIRSRPVFLTGDTRELPSDASWWLLTKMAHSKHKTRFQRWSVLNQHWAKTQLCWMQGCGAKNDLRHSKVLTSNAKSHQKRRVIILSKSRGSTSSIKLATMESVPKKKPKRLMYYMK